MYLSEIWVYPIKSLGGISIKESSTLQSGLALDRRWMLIDKNDKFISQRTDSKLAELGVSIHKDHLSVYHKSNPEYNINIPFEFQIAGSTIASIWKAKVDSLIYPEPINKWFSEFLGFPARLIYMNMDNQRNRTIPFAPNIIELSYADGYPYLLLSKESVEQLNSEIDEHIDIRQFRANLIVEECKAFDEDLLDKFILGETEFRMVKPCKRCQVIGINQDTGVKSKQPTKHLSGTRRDGNGIIFGMNAALIQGSHIKIGDKITSL